MAPAEERRLVADRIIAIGASAGGIEALKTILGGLPADLPAAVLIVQHMSPSAPSVLAWILSRGSRIPASEAVEGEPLAPAHAYVAPPDRHLLVRDRRVHLSRGPRENRQRPAVDPLFRSAARTFGARAIGVVLSGNLDDGTAGLQAIRMAGGATIAQSPEDALFPSMPRAAIASGVVDHVVPASDLGPLLGRIAVSSGAAPARRGSEMPSDEPQLLESEDQSEDLDQKAWEDTLRSGQASTFVCPDCGGTLFELVERSLARYRCRVGHGYSLDTLWAAEADKLDDALWAALRALKEHADLSRRAAERARSRGLDRAAESFEKAAADAERRAEAVRQVLARELPSSGT